MLWNLGLDYADMDNLTRVERKIEELDSEFDLVLLADRWQESMVLMKELLCWDYKDVVSFKLNGRKEDTKQELSRSTRSALQQFLAKAQLSSLDTTMTSVLVSDLNSWNNRSVQFSLNQISITVPGLGLPALQPLQFLV